MSDWASTALNADGDKQEEEWKEAMAHKEESFDIRHSCFYKFDDNSCLQVVIRGSYTTIFLITSEKYEKKKKEYNKVKAQEMKA